jgi:transcriptional regulator with XRE-family HTH domain
MPGLGNDYRQLTVSIICGEPPFSRAVGCFLSGNQRANPIDLTSAHGFACSGSCAECRRELGKALHVSFRQVQKYEKGTNRVSASRLQQIAHALKVTPTFFFDGAATRTGGDADSQYLTIIDQFIYSRDGIALSLAFTKISDAKMRRSIVSLVERITEV